MLGTTVIIPTALVPQMGGGNYHCGSPSEIPAHHEGNAIQIILGFSGLWRIVLWLASASKNSAFPESPNASKLVSRSS
ncbi:hypothetical protein OPV22_028388 [Ensete ventricosum]|uniref:Uncharacterized protein n=1 Tax=Ensete ventricosum TaxID=4639 RepID=A0AAV8Q0C1_ENSVE|nr:hypothetical protein OPV22_028388 [Ensete ventricosum]